MKNKQLRQQTLRKALTMSTMNPTYDLPHYSFANLGPQRGAWLVWMRDWLLYTDE